MAAGDKFRAADVDLVFLQLLTYATSYNVLPAIRDLDVPVVCINVQKKLAPDYANTDIPIWLGDLYACGAVGEAVADLERAGKRHAVITGVVEGGDPEVAAQIEDWCKAAQVRRRFRQTNIAQIGRPYPGMMDLYIDDCISWRSFKSSVPSGSSRRRTFGSLTMARAMAILCCWPPLKESMERCSNPSRFTSFKAYLILSSMYALLFF